MKSGSVRRASLGASLFLPLSCLIPSATAAPFVIAPADADVTATPLVTTPTETEVAQPLDNYFNIVADTEACTTLHRFGGFVLGPTSTVYAATATETVTVDCGPGCNTVEVDNFGGHGPIANFEATITVEATSTITTFVCGATATAPVEAVTTSA